MLTNISGYLSSYFGGVEDVRGGQETAPKDPPKISFVEELSDDDMVVVSKPNKYGYWGDDEGNSGESNDDEEEDDGVDNDDVSSEGEFIDVVGGDDYDPGSSDDLNDYEYIENTNNSKTQTANNNNNYYIIETPNTHPTNNHHTTTDNQPPNDNINATTPSIQINRKSPQKRKRTSLNHTDTSPENSDFERYRGPYINLHRELWGEQEILTDASDQPEVLSSPSFEESWLVTPAPCFVVNEPVEVVKGSMEDLLLKGPTVSIYQKFMSEKERRFGGGVGRFAEEVGKLDGGMGGGVGREMEYGRMGGKSGFLKEGNSCKDDMEIEVNYSTDLDDGGYDDDQGDYDDDQEGYDDDQAGYDDDDKQGTDFRINENSDEEQQIFKCTKSATELKGVGGVGWSGYGGKGRPFERLVRYKMENDVTINDIFYSYLPTNPTHTTTHYYEVSSQERGVGRGGDLKEMDDSGFESFQENYIYNINQPTRQCLLLNQKAISFDPDLILPSVFLNDLIPLNSLASAHAIPSLHKPKPPNTADICTTCTTSPIPSTTLSISSTPTTTVASPPTTQATTDQDMYQNELSGILTKIKSSKRHRNIYEKDVTNGFKRHQYHHHHHPAKKGHHYHHHLYHPHHPHHRQRAS